MPQLSTGKARKWTLGPIPTGLLAGAGILVAACLSGAALYLQAVVVLKQEVRANLKSLAMVSATAVDPELQSHLVSPSQLDTPPYNAAVAPLRKIQRSSQDINFIYTYVLADSGVFFILDASTPGDADSDGVEDRAGVMERYDDSTTAMVNAIRTGMPTFEDSATTDKWGSFLSGYAPLFNATGQVVGALGIDLNMREYARQLLEMRRAAELGLAIALATSLAVGILIALIRRTAVRAEVQREVAHQALTRRNADLADATARAEDASRTKSEFLATMSHEIRTPMNGVIGMLGLVLDSGIAGKERKWAETAASSARALLTIINDILDFSKIEAGKLSFENIDFDLRSTLEDAAELLAERAEAKGLELALLVHPSVPDGLSGDPTRLRQIILNLGGNAIKFTETGEVVIRVSLIAENATGYDLRFEVSDSGIGIPEQGRKHLFQAFRQVDTSTVRRFGGTGLGLSICKQLVELMGGTIGVTSAEGEGSTFWFTVRLGRSVSAPLVVPNQQTLAGIRVLIVEDNENCRLALGHQLEAWGMTVIGAENGRQAHLRLQAAIAQGKPIQLAVLDIHLPDTDGIVLTRLLKNDPRFASLPVVLLTGMGKRGEGKETQEAGAAAYLTKPVRGKALRDCLATVLALHGSEEALASGIAPPLITRHIIAAAQSRRRTKVLLADDNEVNQMLAVELLERTGYRVDVVANGMDAVNAWRTNRYAAILMDCQMPLMDGFEATQAIRQEEKDGSRVPVIAMTANAMQGDRERCIAAGMDDYVTKPIDPEKLYAALREHIVADTEADEPEPDLMVTPESQPVPSEAVGTGPINMAQLQSIVGPNEEKSRRMLRLYVTSTASTVTSLRSALNAHDGVAVLRDAHKLKGSSSSIGAEQLALLAASAEEVGASGEWDSAEDLQQQLHDSFTQARQFAEAF